MPSSETPRPEHPNPSFVRPSWLSLNGPWEFCFDPANEGEQQRWWSPTVRPTSGVSRPTRFNREIIVPFPWESPASGVNEPGYQGVAWYRRTFTVPPEWRARALEPVLHFGAVDWEARVWVNGRIAAEHLGGFSPFSVPLAPFLGVGDTATVTLRVRDDCDAATLLGKQTIRWYTHTSGIWQPVWLEGRPADHVVSIALRPSLAEGRIGAAVALEVQAAGDYRLAASSPDGAFATEQHDVALAVGPNVVELELPIADPRSWSPDDPYLYSVDVALEAPSGTRDEVRTYTGLRDVRTGQWDGRSHSYVFLNGAPVYLRMALDQAFHPDGVYAYPSDDTIRADLQAAKDAGLNGLRCHIKINDPRYYYWADRLGLLIMQDIPNPMVATPASQHAWEACLRATIARDGNHPCIFAWVLFNETWGLTEHDAPSSWRWLAQQVETTKALDPTRLVEDNSPCYYDHVRTELNTWHFYLDDWDTARRHIQRVVDATYTGSPFNFVAGRSAAPEAERYTQGAQPLLNSEYAGVGAGDGDRDISQSLKYLTNELRRQDKIGGFVYTELTDVEWEHNGLLEYDRSPKTFGYDAFVEGMSLRDVLGADVVGFVAPPCQTLPPGAVFSAAAFVSHWSARDLGSATLRWRVDVLDRFGERFVYRDGELAVTPTRYAVTDAGEVAFNVPNAAGLATVALWLVDAQGATIARNYVNVEVWEAPASRQERAPSGWALRVAPNAYRASTWPEVIECGGGAKVAMGAGGTLVNGQSGSVTYEFPWPREAASSVVRGLRLRLEVGTRGNKSRGTAWGAKVPGYPQTEPGRSAPGQLVVRLNGQEVERRLLADDPNDARGVLSFHQHTDDDSSYGELLDIHLTGDRARTIIAEAQRAGTVTLELSVPREGPAQGLSIYGERMGAYPCDPTLLVDVEA